MPLLRTYRFGLSMALLTAFWLGALLWGGLGLGADRSLYLALYAGGDPPLLALSRFLSMLGRYYVLIPLAIAAAVYLAFKRRRRAALLLVIVFGCRLLVELQKTIFARPRPILTDHLVEVSSLSFPSGHSANSMATLVAVALLLPTGMRWKWIGVTGAVLLSLLVGFSRVALGVHWPSDVIGGWAFGLLWLLLMVRLASTRDAAPGP